MKTQKTRGETTTTTVNRDGAASDPEGVAQVSSWAGRLSGDKMQTHLFTIRTCISLTGPDGCVSQRVDVDVHIVEAGSGRGGGVRARELLVDPSTESWNSHREAL